MKPSESRHRPCRCGPSAGWSGARTGKTYCEQERRRDDRCKHRDGTDRRRSCDSVRACHRRHPGRRCCRRPGHRRCVAEFRRAESSLRGAWWGLRYW
jgi:hypothetical protein